MVQLVMYLVTAQSFKNGFDFILVAPKVEAGLSDQDE